MSREIYIAICGKKEQLEKLITVVETFISNSLEISQIGRNFFSKFKIYEIESNFFALQFYCNDFELEFEIFSILEFLFSKSSKMKISYKSFHITNKIDNQSRKIHEKDNSLILGNKFDLRVHALFNNLMLCSNCFKDQGLRLDSFRIGIDKEGVCPNCKTSDGKKLTEKLIQDLAYRFFVRGTFKKAKYGGAPLIQFNNHHYKKFDITKIFLSPLKEDIQLIEENIKMGFFPYGPRLWMIGENEPLNSLQKKNEAYKVIPQILCKYPKKTLSKNSIFFRLRKNPKNPSNHFEYDSPPIHFSGKNRLDSKELSIMYASQDLDICIHESRVTVEDDLFLATLRPTRDLKLLDLTEIIQENLWEFESIDIALHMLFSAGRHSYRISRKISAAIHKSGLDGVIYPSYFSLVRTGAMPFDTIYGISVRRLPSYLEQAKSEIIENIAIFGKPIADKLVTVECINKLILNKVKYDYQFGPVIF